MPVDVQFSTDEETALAHGIVARTPDKVLVVLPAGADREQVDAMLGFLLTDDELAELRETV
jgi:hypothetical protein